MCWNCVARRCEMSRMMREYVVRGGRGGGARERESKISIDSEKWRYTTRSHDICKCATNLTRGVGNNERHAGLRGEANGR